MNLYNEETCKNRQNRANYINLQTTQEGMRIYDFVHAYQPFFEENMPDWVIKNLEEVFVPLSKALAAGLTKKTVQIQGWTLDSWFNNEKTRPYFEEIIKNLRIAHANNNVQFAFSAYSHPILPLLSNNLIEKEINEDYHAVLKYLGEPEIFFPPEGAIDERTVNIIHDVFPDIKIMIPDKCLGDETVSGFYKFKHRDIIVFPVLVKDTLMGAPYFDKPPAFVPETVDWKNAKKAFKDCKAMKQFFKEMNLKQAIIARDMENGESRNALKSFGKGIKDIPALVDCNRDLRFLDWANYDGEIKTIGPGSWEPLSHETDPYPFWAPKGEYLIFLTSQQRELIDAWISLINLYDHLIFSNEHLFKETSPIIISCFPWHFTTPLEWDNNIGFSEYILESCIKTRFPKLLKSKEDKTTYNKIIKSLETNLKKLQKIKSCRISYTDSNKDTTKTNS